MISQRAIYGTFNQDFNFNFRNDNKKKSYERRGYRSIDEKSLSKAMSGKKISEQLSNNGRQTQFG